MTLQLHYLPPPPALAAIVSAFYLFESPDADLDEVERADLPQLRFHLAGSGHLLIRDGTKLEYPDVALMGPRMSATRNIAKGPFRVFGMGLLPAGWASIVGTDASESTNKVLAAEEMIGSYLGDLPATISQLQNADDMIDAFVRNHAKHSAALHPASSSFIRLVDTWIEGAMNPDVSDLLNSSSMSQRTLERMVRKFYGAPPKQLARKYRALRAANAIVHGEGPWQDYANELYYDHSHCIRDIKEFVGVTPAQLRTHGHELLHLTFGRRLLAGRIADISAKS